MVMMQFNLLLTLTCFLAVYYRLWMSRGQVKVDGRYCRTSDHADWLILLHVTLLICVSLFSIEIEKVEFDQRFFEGLSIGGSTFVFFRLGHKLTHNKWLIIYEPYKMSHKNDLWASLPIFFNINSIRIIRFQITLKIK